MERRTVFLQVLTQRCTLTSMQTPYATPQTNHSRRFGRGWNGRFSLSVCGFDPFSFRLYFLSQTMLVSLYFLLFQILVLCRRRRLSDTLKTGLTVWKVLSARLQTECYKKIFNAVVLKLFTFKWQKICLFNKEIQLFLLTELQLFKMSLFSFCQLKKKSDLTCNKLTKA